MELIIMLPQELHGVSRTPPPPSMRGFGSLFAACHISCSTPYLMYFFVQIAACSSKSYFRLQFSPQKYIKMVTSFLFCQNLVLFLSAHSVFTKQLPSFPDHEQQSAAHTYLSMVLTRSSLWLRFCVKMLLRPLCFKTSWEVLQKMPVTRRKNPKANRQ